MTSMEPRVTLQVLKVLEAMLDDAQEEHYGFELSKVTGLKSGTLYPILARLEAASWVTSGWESGGARVGPRRRYYQLTGLGERTAREHLASAPGAAKSRTSGLRPAPVPAWGGAR